MGRKAKRNYSKDDEEKNSELIKKLEDEQEQEQQALEKERLLLHNEEELEYDIIRLMIDVKEKYPEYFKNCDEDVFCDFFKHYIDVE